MQRPLLSCPLHMFLLFHSLKLILAFQSFLCTILSSTKDMPEQMTISVPLHTQRKGEREMFLYISQIVTLFRSRSGDLWQNGQIFNTSPNRPVAHLGLGGGRRAKIYKYFYTDYEISTPHYNLSLLFLWLGRFNSVSAGPEGKI